MTMGVAWVVLAVILGITEVATLAFYAAFLALGAIAAAVAAALGVDPVLQAVVFLVVSVLGLVVLRPFVTRLRGPKLVSGAPGMVGQEALVADPITGGLNPGHVKIAGELWMAVSEDGAQVPAGTTVKVTEIRGSTLVVRPTA